MMNSPLEIYKQGLLEQEENPDIDEDKFWQFKMDRAWYAMTSEEMNEARKFAIELNKKEKGINMRVTTKGYLTTNDEKLDVSFQVQQVSRDTVILYLTGMPEVGDKLDIGIPIDGVILEQLEDLLRVIRGKLKGMNQI